MPARANILVVDDEEGIREFCVGALEDASFHVDSAASAKDALALLESGRIDIVLSDLKMPGMDGLALLRAIRETDLDVDVIMMSAHATVSTAVEATKLGAYDYITKPFTIDDLTALFDRLLERRQLLADNRVLREQLETQGGFGGMVGTSPPMQDLYRFLLKVAPKKCPVLIMGESGTGKELVARAIHAHSTRAARPFVTADCGALTPTLIESELFGHISGAFTGATRDRQGLFRTAQDGTVFLDEIGELPLELQAKLLRVLQESEFRPVGSDAPTPLRARVIAATNRDLEAAIKNKTFREDLYYRLNVLTARLVPLRERKGDIAQLVQSFLIRYADPASQIVGITPEALAQLTRHDWPGNVRELENAVRHALAVGAGPLIEVRDLPSELRRATGDTERRPYLAEVERRAILEVLEQTGGNRANAAKMLGIGKTTLYNKLKEYGIECPSAES